MLKVLPWKGVVRFGKRGKLNPRYVGPFKFHADEPLAVPLDGLHFDDKLQFVEEPVEIMDCDVKWLKQSRIPLVKVRWNSRRGPDFTWEREDQFRKKYPHLFTKTTPSSNNVISDSNESGVTHTEISSIFEELSDIGSPGVIPSPDYISGPEEPQSPPLLDYVPEPIYPEYMPHKDEVFPVEEKPLPAVALPTAQSPDYDDEDDDVDIEADEDEEEEEHPAPTDSVLVALPVADQASLAEETEPFETDESAATPPPHPAYRVIARISIPAPVPTPVWSDAEVARLLAISTLPSSPLSPWSSPLPQIPSPLIPPILSPTLPVSPPLPVSIPLPVSSPVHVLSPSPPASPIRPLGYRAAMIRLRAKAASISYSLPLPPPLHLLSTDRREDRPEVTLPHRKRLGIALGLAYEVGESSSTVAARLAGGLRADYGFVATMDREIRRDPKRDVGYGITDSWDEIVETLQGAPVSTDTELGRHMIAFETKVRQDTDEIYTRMSREEWVGSMVASDLACVEVMSLRTTKIAPKRATRSNIALETTNTTSVTNTQLQAMINQGVTAALAARDANMNGIDSYNSGTSARRNEQATRLLELKVKGADVIGYNQHFQELALLCGRMFPEESNKIEKYVGGLPDMIHGSVVATKPKTMQEATEMEIEVMDKRIRTFADCQTERSGNKKQYGGSKPLCPKCNYNHNGPCAPICYKCNKFGHLARDCRSSASVNPGSNQRGNRTGQGPTCFECGVRGHFKKDCLKLKNNNNNNNNNRGNQVSNANAPAKVYAVGHARTNLDSNVVTRMFLLNNHYASVLFDIGADRSFVSTAFSSQIDITPSTLDHYYDVELADGRIMLASIY
ncbi:putative reverse transcriptase domain-containing protein [Tanacetum coccineum]